MFEVGGAVWALGLVLCPPSESRQERGPQHPTSPRNRGGRRCALGGGRGQMSPLVVQSSDAVIILPLSRPQPMEQGVTATLRRDFHVIVTFCDSDKRSQNLCFLELLALLFR